MGDALTAAKHKIQEAVEALIARKRVPRLQINAHKAIVPEDVRQKNGKRLVIDLDPSWPMGLTWDRFGMGATLSFNGHPHACHFPWNSVYVVIDRATGDGQVFEEHVPPDVIASAKAKVLVGREAEDYVAQLISPEAEEALKKIDVLMCLAKDPRLTDAARESARARATSLARKHDILYASGLSPAVEAERRRASFTLVKGGKK